jgi:2-methylcitrate dehydratase PrpD
MTATAAPSVGRRLATWAAGLDLDDLPAPAVEKVRSLVLHHLVGAVFGRGRPRVQQLVADVRSESPRADGARILGVSGPRVTRDAAAMANAEILNAARLNDSFRMITHPGPVLISIVLTNAELEGRSWGDVLTALAAGYEVTCRLADDYVPSVAAHGFRPAPVFATIGGAVTAGRLFGLDPDAMLAAIGLAANVAGGLNESRRDALAGGNENAIHQLNAARQGLFAAAMGRTGRYRGSELIIEGRAGLYAAFAGSRDGHLSQSFDGPLKVPVGKITEGLGRDWLLLQVMFRVYPVAGYVQPVIELMAELRRRHAIEPAAIAEVVVSVNELETLYPSPRFPRIPDPETPRVGSIAYYVAHVAANGGFPVVGGATFGPTGTRLEEDASVLDLMQRVRLVAVPGQALFSPRIRIDLVDGRTVEGTWPSARLEWTFDELVGRLQACVPGLPGGQERLDRLVATVRGLGALDGVGSLFDAVGDD